MGLVDIPQKPGDPSNPDLNEFFPIRGLYPFGRDIPPFCKCTHYISNAVFTSHIK